MLVWNDAFWLCCLSFFVQQSAKGFFPSGEQDLTALFDDFAAGFDGFFGGFENVGS